MKNMESKKASTIAMDAQDEFVKKLISFREQPDLSKDEIILLFTLLFDYIDKNDKYYIFKNLECFDGCLSRYSRLGSKIIEMQNNKAL
jgi:hypothetical protein